MKWLGEGRKAWRIRDKVGERDQMKFCRFVTSKLALKYEEERV